MLGELEDEVRDIKGTLEGGGLRGTGLLIRVEGMEREHKDIKDIVAAFASAEEKRQQRNGRFQTVAGSLLTAIVSGIVLQFFLMYLGN